MKCVILHIDRLVLRDVRQDDRQAVVMRVRESLERAFGNKETVRHLREIGNLARLKLSGMDFGPEATRPAREIKKDTFK
jgi:hypothetical protein